jgi:hypothetical protein
MPKNSLLTHILSNRCFIPVFARDFLGMADRDQCQSSATYEL